MQVMMTVRGRKTDYPGAIEQQKKSQEARTHCESLGTTLNFKVHICTTGIIPFHVYLSDFC